MPETDSINVVYDILILVSVLLALISIRDFVEIFPTATKCLLKWKEAARLEFNLSARRTRNMVYYVLILPTCLMLDRFPMSQPSFMAHLNPILHIACTIVIFIVYTWLRLLMKNVCTGKKADVLAHNGAYYLFRTLFCITTPFIIATAGLSTLAGVSFQTVLNIVYVEILLSYILLLWRQREILIHYRSGLATILYLCGVEILPVCFVALLWFV